MSAVNLEGFVINIGFKACVECVQEDKSVDAVGGNVEQCRVFPHLITPIT